MTNRTIPRVVIAGTQSGVGKTTIVTGLLAALVKQGLTVQSYKVGPDYIDPGYHQLASGRAAHNLDTWLMPPEAVVRTFAHAAADVDIAIVEGVMGLYDGGRQGVSSTAALAKLLQAPVILVLDAKSMGESAAAIALGFKNYDPEVQLAGVIVNRLGSLTHKQMIVSALERLSIPVLGCLFRDAALAMPERHLGLTPTTEFAGETAVQHMAAAVAQQIDLAALQAVAQQAGPLPLPVPRAYAERHTVRIGVAQDEAFSFYYPESLEVLTAMGVELIPFSPLHDAALPSVDGLLLGGGFPEMFVAQLTANTAMRAALQAAGQSGMPIYAECGGFMYLMNRIIDFQGQSYEMAGLIPAAAVMEKKLQTVGYVEATPLVDTIVGEAGAVLRGHEFHFSRMVPEVPAEEFPWGFTFTKVRTGAAAKGGYTAANITASYLHMHFAGNEEAARRFIRQCQQYHTRRMQP